MIEILLFSWTSPSLGENQWWFIVFYMFHHSDLNILPFKSSFLVLVGIAVYFFVFVLQSLLFQLVLACFQGSSNHSKFSIPCNIPRSTKNVCERKERQFGKGLTLVSCAVDMEGSGDKHFCCRWARRRIPEAHREELYHILRMIGPLVRTGTVHTSCSVSKNSKKTVRNCDDCGPQADEYKRRLMTVCDCQKIF